MDERSAHKIKALLDEIRSILTSEHAPFARPITQNLEFAYNAINSGTHQICDNQQQIYDAIMQSNEQQQQEITILKLQLELTINQNKLMLKALEQLLPISGAACLDSATTVVEKVAKTAAQLNAPKASNPFM